MNTQPVCTRRLVRGFSLVELVVTMALLALLAVLAVPTLTDWRRNQAIRGTAEALRDGMQAAREEAVRRNRPMSWWLLQDVALDDTCRLATDALAMGSWVVSAEDPTGRCAQAGRQVPGAVVASFEATSDVRVVAVDGQGRPVQRLIFSALGRLVPGNVALPVRIDVRDPSDTVGADGGAYRSLRLLVSGTGAVWLCDPALAPDGDDPRRCPGP
jgi:type IV fimbrial biogenesis protein FimT